MYIAPKPWSDRLEGRSRGFSDLHEYHGISLPTGVPRLCAPLPQTGRQVDRAHPRPCPSLHGREPQADPAI